MSNWRPFIPDADLRLTGEELIELIKLNFAEGRYVRAYGFSCQRPSDLGGEKDIVNRTLLELYADLSCACSTHIVEDYAYFSVRALRKIGEYYRGGVIGNAELVQLSEGIERLKRVGSIKFSSRNTLPDAHAEYRELLKNAEDLIAIQTYNDQRGLET